MRNARSPLTWLGGLLALYLLVPILAFVVRFAGDPGSGFDGVGLAEAFWTSVASASISTAIIVLFGVPLAYRLARSNSWLSRGLTVLVQLPLALPPVMSGIVLIYIVGPYTFLGELFDDGLTSSLAGIVIAQTFVASPFLVIAARSAFAATDPALDDLAATLGHRPLARFLRVALPAASDGIKAGILLTWLRALGEYGATVLLAYHPYSLPVFTSVQFQSAGLPGTQAPTALALGLAVVAVLLGVIRLPARRGRRARRRLDRGGVVARPPHPSPPLAVSFDLDAHVGTFGLRVAHAASTHRIALLGPSGSGKSVTLRALAGLLGDRVGGVRYGGVAATGDTERRGIGYVAQGGTLLPGRTVWQQVLFGVGADPAVALWWLETLGLAGLEDRLPTELSGGQRQRVALAMALAREPRLVLLDEPFSALDAPVREELRREVRRLQAETGLSTVLVTHDPEEAALLADEIVVIADGRLLQAGSRAEVYSRPSSPEVARLLGIPNLLRGEALAGSGVSATSSGVAGPRGVVAPRSAVSVAVRVETPPHGFAAATAVLWSVRPEKLVVVRRGERSGWGARDGDEPVRLEAVVTDVADLGASTTVTVALAGDAAAPAPDGGLPARGGTAPTGKSVELRVHTTDPVDLRLGDSCDLLYRPADVSVWAADAEPHRLRPAAAAAGSRSAKLEQ